MNEKNNNLSKKAPVSSDEPIISDEELKMPEESFQMGGEEEKPSYLGIILGLLIVILVLLLGGLYLWGSTIETEVPVTPTVTRPTAQENNEPESTEAEAEVETMQALSTSDEIEAIEADLESTDLDELDDELNAIEAELEAALQ